MGTQINQLSEVDTCTPGQQVPCYDPNHGDMRKFSLSTLLAWLQGALTLGRAEALSQYAAPSATGFSVQVNDDNKDVHLILTPVAGYATGTIVLPQATNCRDKQRLIVNCTQAVTTLAISLNGASAVTGAPTTLAANAFFTLEYDQVTRTWYRIA